MAGHGVQAVDDFQKLLRQMLNEAEVVKQADTVEPPLNKADLGDLFAQVNSIFPPLESPEVRKRSQYAVIETAVRDTFNDLLASATIDTPSFVKLWNLLDIISTFSDDQQCDPALLFWLVEELLDSQTIAGCRRIFDYLESRRERITAKHFPQKQLIILRSCNELLRRLSRAEDTAFCGRVFIFLFQSFPLGDKSSVNLRGEYHTENVTMFDEVLAKQLETEGMDVDSSEPKSSAALKLQSHGTTSVQKPTEEHSLIKGAASPKPELSMSADELYPIFWSLQQSFSQPKKLFDKALFSNFKSGIEATMVMFKSVDQRTTNSISLTDDDKRGIKRKRSPGDDDLANAFNPKYLTSRDLFELEISDLSFRRHILVQILIVLDFLLSLSVKAKEKLSKTLPESVNKSVLYADQSFSEEDTQWALDMRKAISDYLKGGPDGRYFDRMVDSVLSRDKHWVRWKMENCPSISRPATTIEEYNTAKASARKSTTNKRLRPNPLGSLDLKFLSGGDAHTGLQLLKGPSRYEVPEYKSFKNKIELDDMDIDMASDGEEKTSVIESKASKTWRALRIASKTKLVSFDKIDRFDKIDEIFLDNVKVDEPANVEDETSDGVDLVYPKDRGPVVISGPSGAGKSTLIKMLTEKHSKIFGKKASHTTRPPREGEVNGQHYFFVTKGDYDVMRDADGFLEYNNFNGNDYGTSRKAVEGIIAQGKVPVMEMDVNGIRQVKEQGFQARFIFIAPPEIPELERRLRQRKLNSDDEIQARLEIAHEELEQAKEDGLHDKILVNSDLEETYKVLENYIFGAEEASGATIDTSETTAPEVEIADDNGQATASATGKEETSKTDEG